ncbi:MAG: hypothetical protein N2035_07220 [Chthoniobacterales bacterium]|nr:hypothetical protein [Chthoniobacterales bacterium]
MIKLIPPLVILTSLFVKNSIAAAIANSIHQPTQQQHPAKTSPTNLSIAFDSLYIYYAFSITYV